MEAPKELSLSEIRKYMLENDGKVTNHALVKHFKRFLTHPETQNEARKEFKTYVNILATIKNENNQKYLILRKKYLNECPSEDVVQRAVSQAGGSDSVPSSPGGVSLTSEIASGSPFRQPPPYKPPPEVASPLAKVSQTPVATGVAVHEENVNNYRECVNEFATAMTRIDPKRLERQSSENEPETPTPSMPGDDNKRIELEKKANREKSVSRANSVDESVGNKENIPRFSFSSGSSATSTDGSGEKSSGPDVDTENPISVKEATRKFNRMASEEEAKIISPPSKKKPEKQLIEEKELPEVTLAHPKAKEWIVSMAKANYQELSKLAKEYPELVKLHDPATGYTALHWAAKHGNEDVCKLIAGTYKADVNAQTNGGYTPLHIAMQFGRSNIFALLCNTYKANRDLLDWAGNKPLEYSKQQTSVSASTYSKIKAKRKPTVEKDSGFLRIGSLNVRVKKTTEAFSNFLGVGNGTGNTVHNAPHPHYPQTASTIANHPHQRHHRHHHYPHHLHAPAGMMRNQHNIHPMMMKKSATMTMKNPPSSMNHRHLSAVAGSRASVPINSTKYDMLHKSWGSADNVTQNGINHVDDDEDYEDSLMPPPKSALDSVKKRQKNAKRSSIASNTTDSPRDSISSTSSSNFNSGYSSMPTTPNQLRSPLGLGVANNLVADSDSDSACGFDSNWSINGRSSLSSGNLKSSKY